MGNKIKLKQYTKATLKRVVVLGIILYCFSALDFFLRWTDTVLFALGLKMILSVAFLIYLIASIRAGLRELFHGGKYLSVFPDKKEILLTEIYKEIKSSKEEERENKEEYIYMGELKTEDTNNTIIKK